ncbi:MAG: 23S rRNA (pseudouridine(1915)-N(3))-methyltransferase RlmH [Bacillus thermozeamaize]|jgi:23S rRNA (pseudouridine1915-N3)-methyltransferase|uniref:Ribosomal RNA large subunit methyltransferase H n=1 Tax=Bacillus thermozeamaize TaxID=230954 RepID=A0A1Y3PTH4_9BACI|nr:MAG: 23S rRNA (pseudouridine(1915)-N(3))-methyltransferase RlmH [Bacillus thermozeamaize]
MKVTLVAVGSIKERYMQQGIADYVKRLRPYARLDIVEVKEEKAPEHLSAAQEEQVREREGERILQRLPDGSPGAKVVVLDMRGKMLSSEELAAQMAEWATYGTHQLYLVIGGSLGLSRTVRERADLLWSFSRLTFPHQLMRLMVLEQLYRAFKIQRGETYHK